MAQQKYSIHLIRDAKPTLPVKVFNTLYGYFGPQGWWPAKTPFEVIAGAVLTQHTAWRNVEKALNALRAENQLSLKAFIKIPENQLAQLIRPSGFFNLKARRLKTLVGFIEKEYKGSLDLFCTEAGETLRGKLLALNGLGPETVDSILLYATEKPYFVIDAYTRRIFSRHQWAHPEATYESLQHYFMSQLPGNVKVYNEYHALIVKTAKLHCKKKADCRDCPLNIFPIPE